jgi:hypothetical protein
MRHPQIQVLTIALCFHQFLEAIALSSFIVRAQLGLVAGALLLLNSYNWGSQTTHEEVVNCPECD